MRIRGNRPTSIRRVIGVAAVVALLATGCDTGLIDVVAGTGAAGTSGDGGPATSATLEQAGAVAAIPGGGFYVVDPIACVIRKVDASGTITTIAGDGTCGYAGDGGPATSAEIRPASQAFLASAGHLATDSAGNVYLADSGNGRIRKIATDGTITTIAGDGTIVPLANIDAANCSGTTAYAGGVTVTPDGTVYVACPFGIGKVLPDGTLQQVLSTNPASLASDASGTLYFDVYFQGVIKSLDPATGTTATVSDLGATLSNDASGTVPIATDLAVSPDGTLFAAFGPTNYILGCTIEGCSTFQAVDRHIVVRIADGTPVVIAGTGYPDPDTGTQTGYGRDLSLDPFGIASAGNDALLITSSRNVYRIADPEHANPSSGSSCTAAVHPGADFSGLDLGPVDLHRCDLSGTNLTGTDLSAANLTLAHGTGIVGTPAALPPGFGIVNGTLVGPGVDLSHQNLDDGVFDGVDLAGADLTGSHLWRTSFRGTNLAGANLTGTFMQLSDFTGADLTGATLNGIADGCGNRSADFTDADLTDVHMDQVSKLCGPVFTGANLSGADLTGYYQRSPYTFSGPLIESGGIVGTPSMPSGWKLVAGHLVAPFADLAGVDLTGVDLTGVDLTRSDLTAADLSGANLRGDSFLYTNLTNADLTNADLDNTLLRNTDLSGAQLAGASATGIAGYVLQGVAASLPTGISYPHNSTAYLVGPDVDLSGLILDGLDLSGIDLTGADLTDVSLNGANLDGTNFSGTTVTRLEATAIAGAPVNLPPSWTQRGDVLIGPYASFCNFCHVSNNTITIHDVDLTGVDLTGVNFERTVVTNVDLSAADLTQSIVDQVKLTNVDLTGADLTGANFSSASFEAVNLHGATVQGTSFPSQTVDHFSHVRADHLVGAAAVSPSGWSQHGSLLLGPTASLSGADLSGLDLSHVFFNQVDLNGADLSNADLSNTTFSNSDVRGVAFTGADLTGASLPNADLTGADLSGADLGGAHLGTANLSYANLTNARLANATLDHVTANHASLTGADFSGASLTWLRAGAVVGTPINLPTGWALRGTFLLGPDAYAAGFNMTGIDLSGLDLTGASLSHSNLTNTNLSGTILSGTDLTSATFTGATGTPSGGSTATYSATTCPDATVATSPATCVGHGFAG